MGSRRNIYVRHWRIVQALHGRRRGIRIVDLIREADAKRATLYRDLSLLRDAGFPIVSELRNGEAWHSLVSNNVPPLQPTEIEVHALRLARLALAPLEGSSFAKRIDDLLARVPTIDGKAPRKSRVSTRRAPIASPDIVARLEEALDKQRRVKLLYRGHRDPRARWRTVDPLGIRLAKDHVYLIAHDVVARARRTFKIARISRITLLRERAADHPNLDPEELFKSSVKIWTADDPADLVPVAIHLAQPVAHLAREYPLLHTQTITDAPNNNGVIIRAEVAGLEETLRWTLAWGQHATPLCPPDLVSAVRTEHEAALEKLRSPRSRPTRSRRLKDRETAPIHKAGGGSR